VENPKIRGAQRLQRSVSELPLRYAPFYSRLAGLWGVPEQRVEAELTRAADPRSWSKSPLRGLKTFMVNLGAERRDLRVRLLHLAPGAHFPRHQHLGSESVLVLEGSYTDSDGTHVSAGEQQHMPPGSAHSLRVDSAICVAAVTERGIEFETPWLRWLTRLFSSRPA
jgi:anti-sigma factor ChrR (cupin superfamily)